MPNINDQIRTLEIRTLGALIMHTHLTPRLIQLMSDTWDTAWAHHDARHVANTIAGRVHRQEPIDPIALTDCFAYDRSLYEWITTTVIPAAAEPIAAENTARQLGDLTKILHVQQAARAISEGDYATTAELQADAAILIGSTNLSVVEGMSIANLIDEENTRYTAAAERDTSLTGIPTGIPGIDAATRGWQIGNMITVAARPGHGKTILLGQFTRAAAESGTPAVIYSHEMTGNEYVRRLICNMASLDYATVERGNLNIATLSRYLEYKKKLATLPIHIIEEQAPNPQDYVAHARYMRHKLGRPFMIGVDHIHLEFHEKPHPNRTQELAIISNMWRNCAKTTETAVIVCAQLNRDAAAAAPRLHQIRDCGSIEQDTHVGILLWRPYADISTQSESWWPGKKVKAKTTSDEIPPANYAEINIAKNRGSHSARIPCLFEGYCMRITHWEDTDRAQTHEALRYSETITRNQQAATQSPLPAQPTETQADLEI